jgi:hypothetical protein
MQLSGVWFKMRGPRAGNQETREGEDGKSGLVAGILAASRFSQKNELEVEE